MDEITLEQLDMLKKNFEAIEQQMAEGMSPQSLDTAISQVTKSIEILQRMQTQLTSGEALKSARQVTPASDDESPLRRS